MIIPRSRRINVFSAARFVCESLERRLQLTAPAWSNFNFNHDPPFGEPQTHSLTIDFNMDVRSGQGQILDGLTNSDLTLEKVGADANVPASSIELTYNGTNPAKFTFTNTGGFRPDLLPGGNYRASISQQEIVNGPAQTPMQMTSNALRDFFVLSGDANHDRTVNLADFNIMSANFGQTGRRYSEGNFDYDAAGNVNLTDFNQLAANFGNSMPAPPTGPDVLEVGENANFTFLLMWDDTVEGETGWRVQQSMTGQFDDAVAYNLGPDIKGWTTPVFPDGTRVWFRSRAYSDSQTNPDGPNTAYTPKRYGVTPLPAPLITSVQALSPSQIKVSFTDNSQNETEFHLYRSLTSTGTYTHVKTIASGQPTEFTDDDLQPNTTYYYRVRAHNLVTDSAPSNTGNATTHTTVQPIDLDVFEDANGDFIHDNSAAGEQSEATQPTELPFNEEDGDYRQLALIANGALPSATVTFNYSQTQLQLYQDRMGLYPVNPGQTISLSNLGIGSGSGTVVMFAKLTTTSPTSGTVTLQLGGGSSGSNVAFGGGVTRRTGGDPQRPDNPSWHNNVTDYDGGLDDGDGIGGLYGDPNAPPEDPLTNRDDFWHPMRNGGKRTLIIGFSGHTQSRGTHGINGRIWNIFDDAGAYEIGGEIQAFYPGFAVTMFPEDPGNDNFVVLARCGDGVLGRANPFHNAARVDADGNPTGALQFLIDAIVVHGVREVGLFGYSHGGGSLQLLMQALAYRANNNTLLLNKLVGFGGPPIRFFWTAHIDAINISHTTQGGQITDANGTPFAETEYPFGIIPQGPFAVGTEWHYNAYQQWTFWPFGDGVPLGGTELDPDIWPHHSSRLRQEYAEQPSWPRPTDHTDNRGRGIAEDETVQSHVLDSLFEAYQVLQ